MKLNITSSNPNMSDNRDVMELVKAIFDELQRIDDGDIRGGAGRNIIRFEITEDNQQFQLGMMDRFILAGKDIDVHLGNGKWISPDEYNIDQDNVLSLINQDAICKKGDVLFCTPNLGRLIEDSDSEYLKHLRSLWDYLHTSEVDTNTIRVKETVIANRQVTGMINIDNIEGHHLHNILGYTWKNLNNWQSTTDVEFDEESNEYILPKIPYGLKSLGVLPINKYVRPNTHYIALIDVNLLYNLPFIKLTVNSVVKEPYCIETSTPGVKTLVQTFRTGENIKNVTLGLTTDIAPIEDDAMIKYSNMRIYEVSESTFNNIGTVGELTSDALISLYPMCQEPITPVTNPMLMNIGKSSHIHEVKYIDKPVDFKGVDLPAVDIKMYGHTAINLVSNIDKDLHFSKKTTHNHSVNVPCILGTHRSRYYTLNVTMVGLSRPDEVKYPPKLYLVFNNDLNTSTYVGNLPLRNGRCSMTFKISDFRAQDLTGIIVDDMCINQGVSFRLKNLTIINNTWEDYTIPMMTPYIEDGVLFSTKPIIKLNQYQVELDTSELRSLPNGTRDELIIVDKKKTLISNTGKKIITKDDIEVMGEYITNTHIPFKVKIDDMCRSTSFKEDILCAGIPVVDIILPQLMGVDKTTRTYIGITIDGQVILNINIEDDLRNGSLPSVHQWLEEENIEIIYKLNNPLVVTGEIETLNISTENKLDKYSMGIVIPGGIEMKYYSKNPNSHGILFDAVLYEGDVIYPTNFGSYRYLSNWRHLHQEKIILNKEMQNLSVVGISIEVPNHIETVNDIIVCGIEGETAMNLNINKRDGRTFIVFEVDKATIEELGIGYITTDEDFRVLIKREQPLVKEIMAIGSLAITEDSNTIISSSTTGVLPTYKISMPSNIKGAIDTFVTHNIRNSKSIIFDRPAEGQIQDIENNIYTVSPNYIVNGSMQVWEGIPNKKINGLYNLDRIASMFIWNIIDTATDKITAEYVGCKTRFTIGATDKTINKYIKTGGQLVYTIPKDILDNLKGKQVTLSLSINGSFNGSVRQTIHQGISGVGYAPIKDRKDISFNVNRVSTTFDISQDTNLCNISWDIIFPDHIQSCNYIDISDIKLEIGGEATPYFPILYTDELTNVHRYHRVVDCSLTDDMVGKYVIKNGIGRYTTPFISFPDMTINQNPTVTLDCEYGGTNVQSILVNSTGFKIVMADPDIPIKLDSYTIS